MGDLAQLASMAQGLQSRKFQLESEKRDEASRQKLWDASIGLTKI